MGTLHVLFTHDTSRYIERLLALLNADPQVQPCREDVGRIVRRIMAHVAFRGMSWDESAFACVEQTYASIRTMETEEQDSAFREALAIHLTMTGKYLLDPCFTGGTLAYGPMYYAALRASGSLALLWQVRTNGRDQTLALFTCLSNSIANPP